MASLEIASGQPTLTVQNTRLGATPTINGYNSAHFFPGSNTRDWWHYSGVNGARIFISPGQIEPTDDIPGRGDGVTNQTSFLNRKTALRANPLNTTFINWPYFTNRYETYTLTGANRIRVNFACAELRKLGVEIDVNISASQNVLTITNANDWAGKWELWQHYYAQAFYLAREFDVQRFQMFNEPDHSSAGGLTQEDFLQRLQLSSDAIQSAITDVNQIYGKSLTPIILAPVITTASYNSWAQLVVTNRHVNFLDESNSSFSLIHKYDYHQYNVTPAAFGNNLASLQSSLASVMSPEPRFPTTISEFNAHTAAVFDGMTETLDSPSKYTRLGAIIANLVKNFQDELYCFKFGQTIGDVGDNYPVRKNGMHFTDNTNAPYNIGGTTKAGEVYRLFNKSSKPARDLVPVTQGSGTAGLHVFATRDAATRRHHIFSANDSVGVDITLNVSAWAVPNGQRVLLEEVSENIYGGVKSLLTVTNGQIDAGLQSSNTVWLFDVPTQPQEPAQIIFASDDAMVQDGTNRTLNFGSSAVSIVRNSSTNTSQRSVAFLKFRLPQIYLPDIQFVLLTVRASSTNGSDLVQAHVYGITNNNWSQTNITWSNAPNLKQNIAAGMSYANNFIAGQGDGAQMVGQFAADATAQDRMIDVTRFILENPSRDVSFLMAREVRFHGDTQNSNGFNFVTKEGDTNFAPRLILVRAKDSDGDGIGDDAELNIFATDPNDSDTDNDGASDGQEILVSGTNPGSYPGSVPTIIVQPKDELVALDDEVTFSVNAQGTQPISYQWFFNMTNALAGATNSALSLSNVQASHAGNYRVVVSNALGWVASFNATLIVTNLPLQLFSYESFPYAVGSLLAGQGGWLNNGVNSGGTMEEGNLLVPGLFPASGNRFTWNNSTMSLRMPLGATYNSGQIFFSFAMRVDDLGASFNTDGTFAGLAIGTNASFVSKINIRTNGMDGFTLGMSKGSGTNFGDWATNQFLAGETIFVVGRYVFIGGSSVNDLCDLWLNPSRASFGNDVPPPPTLANQGNGGSDLSQIDRFFFRSGGSAVSPAKLVADELRFGTTWASVTEPEPVLDIQLSGENVILSWPTNLHGLFLQSALSLDPLTDWIDFTNAPSVFGARFVMTNAITGFAQFFRLKK